MSLGILTSIRNAMAQLLATALDAGGGAATIKLYTGAQPATGAALTSQTLLATIVLAYPSAASVLAGTITFTLPAVVAAVASGAAVWARFADSGGNFVCDGTVGVASPADIVLSTNGLVTTGTVTLLGASIAVGNL